MTVADTLRQIALIGRHMTAAYREGEYRVTYKVVAIQLINDCNRADALERAEQLAYYTTDAADAVQTAKAMHKAFRDTSSNRI